MTDVTIEYCVPRGLLNSAVKSRTALLERFGQDLDGVTLAPGHGGVFKVHVDGDTVWDKDVHGGDFDLKLIGDAGDERLATAES